MNRKTFLTEDEMRWVERAKSEKKRFVIVVCDSFSYENYGVTASADELETLKSQYNSKSMQRVEYVLDVKKGTRV